MPTIQINPDVEPDSGFKAFPAGIYRLRLCKALLVKKAETSDNNIIPIEWEIVEHEELNGRKCFDNLVLTIEWQGKVKQFALATGIYTEESLKEDGGNIDLDLFVPGACELWARIGTKTSKYQGETTTKNVIKNYMLEQTPDSEDTATE